MPSSCDQSLIVIWVFKIFPGLPRDVNPPAFQFGFTPHISSVDKTTTKVNMLFCKIIVQKLWFPTFLIKNSHTSSIFPEGELAVWSLLPTSGLHEDRDPSFHLLSPSSPPQSFPASGPFPMSQFFTSGGQSIGASASVLPVNTQCWFPLRLTCLISLKSKGPSRVFTSTTIQKHQFFGAKLSLWDLEYA